MFKNVWEVWGSALSADECDAICERAQDYPQADATVGFVAAQREDLKIRTSAVRWMQCTREAMLVQRLMQFVTSSNRTNFGLSIEAPFDLQFTEYHATRRGHYEWHQDVWLDSPRPFARKLSVVVQLSDPEDYEGGQFEFFGIAAPGSTFAPRGSLLVFPSFLQHRVLPVTKGVRRSLVTWVEGPRWQ